ncbi:DNA mismatch repair endonuclease MutH [Idiomarina tyrosinivorans]|uniref:DNA mismatch repair protein MutH n=1 Tax=Idiomarina tyrosinivorans TaxID=1445662 RepID=A0A432ZR11_9GAMM|nr:DNA mismatch repair endonuclease MutH [Idiomarina tyrosinivorans]RUO80339.1 DNA mismatch repair endonuclease MutH [Idiomarina tyrosinivorans]
MQLEPRRPQTIDELYDRALALAGRSFAELARAAGLAIPDDLRHAKGWVGQLLETHLGATAGSKPLQDFPELGVELKTLPVTPEGEPLETTFVCSAPLTHTTGVDWLSSNVRNKLRCVLWLPIDGRRDIGVAERVVGTAFFWRPSTAQEQQLRADWEEHMDRIALGQVEAITARQGEWLQVRPKAADGNALTDAVGPDGRIIRVRPRGFYLKKRFTRQILQETFTNAC